jgi:hypothetical protein
MKWNFFKRKKWVDDETWSQEDEGIKGTHAGTRGENVGVGTKASNRSFTDNEVYLQLSNISVVSLLEENKRFVLELFELK